MSTVLNGLLGGLAAGVVATAIAWFVDKISSVRALTSRVTGEERMSRRGVAALWVLYGAVAGGLFLLLEVYVLSQLGVPPTVVEAFVAGVGWAAVLSGMWLLFGRVVAGISLRDAAAHWLLVYHGVYGVSFAVWIRFTWIT